jgi:nucleoid DNA-binding protein
MPAKKAVPVKETTPVEVPKRGRKAPVKKSEPTEEVVDGVKAKRNMTAVSSDFVSTVQAALSEELAAKLKVKDVKELCEAFVKTLVDKVRSGETVSFTNNMTFKRQVRSARTYKNLKTGDPIKKPPHYVMSMQIKPALKKVFDELEVADVKEVTAAVTK